MPDPRFHTAPEPVLLGDLADKLGLELDSDEARSQSIVSLAPLTQAGKGDVSFLDNVKYRGFLKDSQATAVILHPSLRETAPDHLHLILAEDPYRTYARVASYLYPQTWPRPGISEQAFIDPSAHIGPDCIIEPYAVIGPDAWIGDGNWISSGAVIGAGVQTGAYCRIGPQASLSHAILGSRVRLFPGVRIGQDGFGYALDTIGSGEGHLAVPQLGRVMIGDDVEIGANTTIDRGAGPDTVIGSGTKIDNLVQIGHNVKIGHMCIIIAQAGVAGSTVLEDGVVLAAQCGIAGHLTIGRGARIGAQAGVIRDVSPGQDILGSPAQPAKSFFRQVATLERLAKRKKET